LKFIFYFLRFANLIWITFTMITVEMTLNYNHIQSVLGENGRIFFPSQLLPTIIGVCSFSRVSYLLFERWRSPKDTKPSLAVSSETPSRHASMPRGNILKLFAPATDHVPAMTAEGKAATELQFESDDLDPEMAGKSLWWRLLVSYLPWLQAAHIWFKHDDYERKLASVNEPKVSLERVHKLPGPLEVDSGDEGRRRTWTSNDTV
jgi:hypothetical protein